MLKARNVDSDQQLAYKTTARLSYLSTERKHRALFLKLHEFVQFKNIITSEFTGEFLHFSLIAKCIGTLQSLHLIFLNHC